MRRICKFLATFSIVLVFFGCELDSGENFHFVNLEVSNAVFPERFILGQTHEILVNFKRPDDCTFFEGFDVLTADSNTRNVVAIGTTITDSECNTTNDEVGATLYFTVVHDITYLFRFFAGRDAGEQPIYIEYEIEVEENASNKH